MNKMLSKIVDYKKQELEHRKRNVSLKDVRAKAEDVAPSLDFVKALKASKFPAIIAEVKKASPSAGVIRADFDSLRIASGYEENGAACLSILTDEKFFQGSLESLEEIRRFVKIPLLRKDFTLEPYHLYEARASGADALLLIVRILEEAQLKDYQALAAELGMAALIEVHTVDEMKRVGAILESPLLIGINNRDLDTFKVDLETTVKLAKEAPKEALLVGESGIGRREDMEKLAQSNVRVFLIGETFLRAADPGKKLREMRS